MPRLLPCLVALALLAPVPALAQTQSYEIQPSAIDSGVRDFDAPNFVIPNTTVHAAPLGVFLTGAGAKPAGTADFLKFVAGQGYPVIGLEYDDDPAAPQACLAKTDPDCSEAVHRMRVDGDSDGPGASPVSNPPVETVTARLTTLLQFLTQDKPGQGWDYYLDGPTLRWDRVVFAGLAQGAGVAAYIGKHHQVARVILLSGPGDIGPDHQPPAWLSLPSATPADRWFAAYQPGETTADLVKIDYTALQVPAGHVRVLTPADGHGATPVNAIRDKRYAVDWASVFGKAVTDGIGQ